MTMQRTPWHRPQHWQETGDGRYLDPERTSDQLVLFFVDEVVASAWRWVEAHGFDPDEISAALEQAVDTFDAQRRGEPDNRRPLTPAEVAGLAELPPVERRPTPSAEDLEKWLGDDHVAT